MLQRTKMLGMATAFALLAMTVPVWAQDAMPTKVRIKAKKVRVLNTPTLAGEVVDVMPNGTDVDVLLEDGGWYWVVLPRDGYGTRRGGWIRVHDVDALEVDDTTTGPLKTKKAVARERKNAARLEAQEAKRRATEAKREAKNPPNGDAPKSKKGKGERADQQETARLKKAQDDLEKARADYAAAVKRRSGSNPATATTSTTAPQ
jgi:hypothetical protein